jgi:serine/threonine-protein kinase
MTSAATSTTAGKLCAAAVFACVLAPRIAMADGLVTSQADTTFKEGRALLDAKRYDEACPKLQQSYTLEPGAGTLLALALCHEGQGKTATAHAELEKAADLGRKNGRNDLAAAAEKRARSMEPSLAKVLIRLPREGSSEYEVRCDGEPVAPERLASPFPLDPGEHKVEVSAKGKASRTYPARLVASSVVEIVVDPLEDAPAPVVAAPVPAPRAAAKHPAVQAESLEAASPAEDKNRGSAQRAIGLVVTGAGVVGLGVGTFFGVRAAMDKAEARSACPRSPCADNSAAEANDRAKASLGASMASFAAGTGAIAIGLVLYFTAPRSEAKATASTGAFKPTASVVPDAGNGQLGLGVAGTF